LLAAFSPIFFCQKLQSQNLSREKLQKTLLYIKGAPKMLRKLTPIRHSPNVTNDLVIKHFQIVNYFGLRNKKNIRYSHMISILKHQNVKIDGPLSKHLGIFDIREALFAPSQKCVEFICDNCTTISSEQKNTIGRRCSRPAFFNQQVSISSTFYVQLIRGQIPNAQKI